MGLFALIAERPPLTNARKPQHSRRYLRRTLSGRDLCAGPADRRGTMLCLAGLGALAGVPVIILVILSPLIGPTLGIKVVRGSCPSCGAKIGSIGPIDTFVCRSCKNKVQVKRRELLPA